MACGISTSLRTNWKGGKTLINVKIIVLRQNKCGYIPSTGSEIPKQLHLTSSVSLVPEVLHLASSVDLNERERKNKG